MHPNHGPKGIRRFGSGTILVLVPIPTLESEKVLINSSQNTQCALYLKTMHRNSTAVTFNIN